MIVKREAAATLLRRSGGGRALRALPAWQGILVLNYHRIGEAAATPFDPDLFSATQERFDAQLAYLTRSCDVIGLDDLERVIRRGRGRYALITFDDGYRDNHDLALPLLRRHKVPAIFFIATGFIDRPVLPWWDEIAWVVRGSEASLLPSGEWFAAPVPLAAGERQAAVRMALARYKTLPAGQTAAFLAFLADACGTGRAPVALGQDLWMSWEMVRALRDAGMSIGAHTVRHQLLARLPETEQALEITGSRDRITTELSTVPTAFAYPVGKPGSYTAATKRLLQEHGFCAAFSFAGGHQPFADLDRFAIRRAHVGHGMSMDAFKAMVTLPRLFAR